MRPGDAARRTRPKAGESLVAGYRPLPGIYDEMVDAGGRVRPHWQRLIAGLGELPREELARRFAVADRALRDSGVFYRVYDEDGGGERPWPLAPLPLVVSAAEWRALARGLKQRAALLEAVLDDAYGPASLVADGALPAALIAGSREFLRPLAGVAPPGGAWLRQYAVDLGRGPDGRWWVLSDRTQAPSGAGYALENRVAVSRALPELFRELEVERLAGFFQAFRAGLAGLVRRDDPRIGLLTPGTLSETYFEHAYLARYLGFLLVEGGDLVVRDDAVYIRTVAGLKRADVLWRRLDADYADPLELNPQSRLGVPGLVDAVRHGSVVIANALGSGFVEARALLGFLPGLARRLTGEDLALPNIATWWCGQPAERDAVLARLDTMAVGPAFEASLPELFDRGMALGSALDTATRARVTATIRRRGADIVGQEVVRLSTMPVWHEGRLEPRPFTLRVFVTRTETGYEVMPGGFCRISSRVDARAVTMQDGGTSADVWVLSDGPVEAVSLLPSPDRSAVRRSTGVLPSRVADNIFWLGRYLERAEATLRVVRALVGRLDAVDPAAAPPVRRLADLLGRWEAAPGKPRPLGLVVTAFAAMTRDDLPGTLPALAAAARGAAASIRERLAPDAWRVLGDLQRLDQSLPAAPTGADLFELANGALRTLSAFAGLAQENMNRHTGWRFLDLGRRIERGIATARFAASFGEEGATFGDLEVLLELADSQITYRSRYLAGLARTPVLDLVLLDPANPRSLAFQIEAIEEHLATLPGGTAAGPLTPPQRIAARLATDLRTADPASLTVEEARAAERALLDLSDEVGARYFSHRGRPEAVAAEELG
jgi:uncharacterized circularly permuted ATP-grasp superfamily protein/uncharacterized alpha-E superfamily protein